MPAGIAGIAVCAVATGNADETADQRACFVAPVSGLGPKPPDPIGEGSPVAADAGLREDRCDFRGQMGRAFAGGLEHHVTEPRVQRQSCQPPPDGGRTTVAINRVEPFEEPDRLCQSRFRRRIQEGEAGRIADPRDREIEGERREVGFQNLRATIGPEAGCLAFRPEAPADAGA